MWGGRGRRAQEPVTPYALPLTPILEKVHDRGGMRRKSVHLLTRKRS